MDSVGFNRSQHPIPKASDHSPGHWTHLHSSHFLFRHPTLTLALHTHLLKASAHPYLGASHHNPSGRFSLSSFSTPPCMNSRCLGSPELVNSSHHICPPRPLHLWTLLVTPSSLFLSQAQPPLAYKLHEDFFPGLIRAAQMQAILHLQWAASNNLTTH